MEMNMAIRSATKTGLGLVVCTACILGANAVLAGEVGGHGNPVPGAENGRSECSYSGQQDEIDSNEGVFKSTRTQSWGQLFNVIRLAVIMSGWAPGAKYPFPLNEELASCNPNASSAG
jgi:hypothetical protein